MGLILTAVIAQTVSTADRARTTIVPSVDLQAVDVRVAIRDLFRQGLFGGTVAPDVQGVVTVSLRNLPWEDVLQNILREVDATYRIDHGFFEIVRRQEEIADLPPITDEFAPDAIAKAYRSIAEGVSRGNRFELRRTLASNFQFRNATGIREGENAIRAFVSVERDFPQFQVERREWPGSKRVGEVRVVAYGRPHAATVYFRDLWQEVSGGNWQLVSREETVLNPLMHFVNVPLSKVLEAVLGPMGVSFTVPPALDKPTTVDLTNLSFEATLQKLLSPIDATYRIEGGVYEIVFRQHSD